MFCFKINLNVIPILEYLILILLNCIEFIKKYFSDEKLLFMFRKKVFELCCISLLGNRRKKIYIKKT